jgi:hypothetical protein|tara:strand:+ start:360 stop:539 length:180 start_codon:yes stop_codon:yes gene_type:complete
MSEKNIEIKKENEWLKIKVNKIDLPNGLKLSGLEFSVYDFETLKMLKSKIQSLLGDFKI